MTSCGNGGQVIRHVCPRPVKIWQIFRYVQRCVTVKLVVQAPVETSPGLHRLALYIISHKELCQPSEDLTPWKGTLGDTIVTVPTIRDSGLKLGPLRMENIKNNTNNSNLNNSNENNSSYDSQSRSNAATTGATPEVFKRSSVIMRTPPAQAGTKEDVIERLRPKNVDESSVISLRSKADTISNKDTNSPTASTSQAASATRGNTSGKSALAKLVDLLGKEIDGLLKYVEPRRNVHGDIRKMCHTIKRAHTDVITHIEIEECKSRHHVQRSSMVSAIQLVTAATTATQTKATSPTTPSTHGNRTTATAKRARANVSPKKTTQPSSKSPEAKKIKADPPKRTDESNEEWRQVQRKKREPKPKEKSRAIRPRPSAIIIEKNTDGVSYADILRAVKTNAQLKDLSEKVKTLRPTRKGGLLLELKKGEPSESKDCWTAIEKALGNMAKVNLSTHNITIQCKGLIAEINTDDELLEAIETQAQVKRPDITAIKSKRNTYGGTQAAYVSLPAEDAKKVLALGHVRVGWVRCRVAEVAAPKRCFKCWAFDHVAANCNGPDRTKLCRRCGVEGHKAAECKNAEKCALCGGEHAAGSGKCVRYKEAVKKSKA